MLEAVCHNGLLCCTQRLLEPLAAFIAPSDKGGASVIAALAHLECEFFSEELAELKGLFEVPSWDIILFLFNVVMLRVLISSRNDETWEQVAKRAGFELGHYERYRYSMLTYSVILTGALCYNFQEPCSELAVNADEIFSHSWGSPTARVTCWLAVALFLGALAFLEVGYFNEVISKVKPPFSEGGAGLTEKNREPLLVAELCSFLPICSLAHLVGRFLEGLKPALGRGLGSLRGFYTKLWYSRRYKKNRRDLRRFWGAPKRVKRAFYLGMKFAALPACWGVNQKIWLNLRCTKGGGALAPRLGKLYKSIRLGFASLRAGAVLCSIYGALRVVGLTLKGLVIYCWSLRPSTFRAVSLIFRPRPLFEERSEAAVRESPRSRLVNFISEMEAFGSKGSSLLVVVFLLWSFCARFVLIAFFLCIL